MPGKASPLQRLHDILDAIDKIDRYTASKGNPEKTNASMLYDAVVRNIEVISEATRHIPADLTSRYPDIPWRAIADIGNILRHGYDHIREDIIWQTVEDDLPPLRKAISEMVAALEKDSR